MRLRFPHARGNQDLLDEIALGYRAIPGVVKVTVKVDTGSIILHYDHLETPDLHHDLAPPPKPHELPGDDINSIAHKIEEEAEFLAEHSHTARVVVDFFKDMDNNIKRASNNTVDLKIVLAVALTGITFVEIGAAAATPMWVTLGIFTLNHVIEMRGTTVRDLPA